VNQPHRKPNLVFVLTDDQGYGDLACHGNPIIKTPHLDKMYAQSVRLTNYHVGPTCAPTRAGLLTGHYANSTGVWHTIGGRSLLRQNEISMADIFAQNGYKTGIFGKWHLGDNYPYRPQDRGFQKVVIHGGGGVGQTPDYWGNNYFDDTYWANGEHKRYPGYCTDVWFNEALKFIERHQDVPFFCYIPTNAPHSPHLVSPRYSDPYRPLTPHQQRANFYGMVTNIDENFGLLRQRLEELGLAENTILIFMTDNGSAGGLETDTDQFITSGYNCGMRGQKGSEYEGGHRVPCFIHWPGAGLAAGRDVPELTANVDILPTLIDLCGLDAGEYDFDGKSLAPLIRGEGLAWEDRAMVTDSQRLVYPVKWRKSAVMTNRWRLINGQELYDIQADPEQRHNIAADQPAVVKGLRREYERWWGKVSTQFDEEIPIVVGDTNAESVVVNTHDWRNEDCACAWNQSQIREGLLCNGYWELTIAQAGRYTFELRRWPRAEDRALREGIPGRPVPFNEMTVESGYGGGNAIPIHMARIKIGACHATRSVTAGDKSITFILDLEAGPAHLQTYLYDEAGAELGAYYVYIDRVQ